jgi:glycosyltransferase involved in cell wall biosynthesis
MDRLQATLAQVYSTHLFSTWSLKRKKPNANLPSTNAFWFHYPLQLYKMIPALQWRNYSYYALCLAFDEWLATKIPQDLAALTYLSGVGLKAGRKAKRRNIPVVIECGSTHTDFQDQILREEYARNHLPYSLFPAVYRERIKTEFNEADFIQIPSHFVGQTLIENGVPESKLLYAPYGADLSRFTPAESKDLNLPFRVICPSGVNLRKGARVLVEAWRRLNWSDAELHWIGKPTPETAHLFDPPLKNIVWHSWMQHDQLSDLYRSCDVMVLPSFEEGLARVMIEAAACGLPLIATPNTGVEELFTPGQPEGWIVPVNQIEALCEALIDAKTHRQKAFDLGQKAALCAQNFSWDAYSARVRENYQRVLN